jgi:hypothetical protein
VIRHYLPNKNKTYYNTFFAFFTLTKHPLFGDGGHLLLREESLNPVLDVVTSSYQLPAAACLFNLFLYELVIINMGTCMINGPGS